MRPQAGQIKLQIQGLLDRTVDMCQYTDIGHSGQPLTGKCLITRVMRLNPHDDSNGHQASEPSVSNQKLVD